MAADKLVQFIMVLIFNLVVQVELAVVVALPKKHLPSTPGTSFKLV